MFHSSFDGAQMVSKPATWCKWKLEECALDEPNGEAGPLDAKQNAT
jgi:hypothetical protein